jgi:prolyl oligopeptidase
MPSPVAIKYPSIRRDDGHVEVKHFTAADGSNKTVELRDPYRWLEDPETGECKQFVTEQNEMFTQYIQQYPHRQQFADQLTKIYDYEKFGCPFKRGQHYYYFHNSGLQAQSVLYRLPVSAVAEGKPAPTATEFPPELFFDPNRLTEDGTAALSTFGFSESGRYFGYGVSYSGSDWVTIMVKDSATKQDLPGVRVEWAKFTRINWTHDDCGFFYSRYPQPAVDDAGTETQCNENAQLRYRYLDGGKDLLILKDEANPKHMFGATVSDDGRYAVISVSESCDPVNKLYLLDLEASGLRDEPQMLKLVDDFKAEYSYITNEGPLFYFKTNLNSPRYKVVRYDLNKPELGFVDFIPQSENNVLQDCSCIAGDRLVAVYLKDCKNTINVFDLASGRLVSDLPVEIGSIDSLTGRKEDDEMFYKLSSFVNPGIIYRYNFRRQSTVLFRETKLNIPGFSSDSLQTEQVFYPSKDGTKIPMFIVSKKVCIFPCSALI